MVTEPINSNQGGVVKISEDVIGVIAAKEVSEVDKVIGLYNAPKQGFLNLKGSSKSVRCDIKDKNANIEIDISVEYGAVIGTVAAIIQDKVKKAVESMTGLNVEYVNVFVKSVEIPEQKIAEE